MFKVALNYINFQNSYILPFHPLVMFAGIKELWIL